MSALWKNDVAQLSVMYTYTDTINIQLICKMRAELQANSIVHRLVRCLKRSVLLLFCIALTSQLKPSASPCPV